MSLNNSLPTAVYWDLWTGTCRWLKQVPRKEWDAFFHFMLSSGLAAPSDRAEFDRHFTNTDRPHLNVCPGIAISFPVDLAESQRQDAANKLVPVLETEVRRVASVLGLPIPRLVRD